MQSYYLFPIRQNKNQRKWICVWRKCISQEPHLNGEVPSETWRD